jgi:histidinol-phosphate phosphatase family protein
MDASDPAAASGWMAVVDDELYGDAALSAPNTSLAHLRSLADDRLRAATHRAGRPTALALVDRDGTVIVDRHYLADPDGVELLPGAAEGLGLLKQAGVKVALVTNQSGIARGLISRDSLEHIHDRLTDLLATQGVVLDGIYVCPHGSEEGCACRKPRIGLAQQAAAELGLPLRDAAVVGDKPADIGLARALGVPATLVTTGEGGATLTSGSDHPDYVVDDLSAMARLHTHPAGLLHPVALPG